MGIRDWFALGLREGDSITFMYWDAEGNHSVRNVDLREIDTETSNPIVTAYDYSRDAIRRFRIDRMENVSRLHCEHCGAALRYGHACSVLS